MNSGDIAAWVQAIGSIAAIVVAGRVVELTSRKARLELLNGVDGIFLFCASSVEDASQAVTNALVDPKPLLTFPDRRLQDCSDMLAGVRATLLEIGSEKLPGLTSDAAEIVESSRRALDQAKAAITTTRNIAAESLLLSQNAAQLQAHRRQVLGLVIQQRKRVRTWWSPLNQAT